MFACAVEPLAIIALPAPAIGLLIPAINRRMDAKSDRIRAGK